LALRLFKVENAVGAENLEAFGIIASEILGAIASFSNAHASDGALGDNVQVITIAEEVGLLRRFVFSPLDLGKVRMRRGALRSHRITEYWGNSPHSMNSII
jgi:hypothetical protein